MNVKPAVVGNCLECHKLPASHLDVPDTACATCHLTLPEAGRLTRSDVAAFPEPESHEEPGFELSGHAKLATAGGQRVAASCATVRM